MPDVPESMTHRAKLSHDNAERHLRRALQLLPRFDAPQVIVDTPEMVNALHDLATAMLRTKLWLRKALSEEGSDDA